MRLSQIDGRFIFSYLSLRSRTLCDLLSIHPCLAPGAIDDSLRTVNGPCHILSTLLSTYAAPGRLMALNSTSKSSMASTSHPPHRRNTQEPVGYASTCWRVRSATSTPWDFK